MAVPKAVYEDGNDFYYRREAITDFLDFWEAFRTEQPRFEYGNVHLTEVEEWMID